MVSTAYNIYKTVVTLWLQINKNNGTTFTNVTTTDRRPACPGGDGGAVRSDPADLVGFWYGVGMLTRFRKYVKSGSNLHSPTRLIMLCPVQNAHGPSII